MQKAIWKALYEHSNNDPALAAFIASRGKGPRWQYDFWSFRVATGISFDEWRELSKGKKRVYTVHQDMEKKMKTNFLIPNSLL